MFAKNESDVDRVVRTILGAGLVVVSISSLGISSAKPLGIAAALIGAVLLFTAATGSCLVYRLVGIETSK